MKRDLTYLCAQKGLKLTGQRRIIAEVIAKSNDHPNVDEIYKRASNLDPKIGIATIYRTVRLFEELGVIEKLEINGKARYEISDNNHHHHLIDIVTGQIIEFENEELEKIKEKISADLGYELVDHKLELYGKPLKK